MLLLTFIVSTAQVFAKNAPSREVKISSLNREMKMLPNSSGPELKQAQAQSRAGSDADTRTWKWVGEGVWVDPIFTWKESGSQCVIDVNIQYCVEQPRVYRIIADDLFETAPIVHCENPQKVYIEDIVYITGDVVSQYCAENGWNLADDLPYKYGTITDNVVYFGPCNNSAENCSFLAYDPSDEKWGLVNHGECKIVFPEGYAVGGWEDEKGDKEDENGGKEDENGDKEDDNSGKGDPNAKSGVYFGITAFNYLPEIMPMKLLSLDNKQEYKNFVNSRTTDDYTFLYYSAEQALAALKSVSYPTDLSNVTLITFTDGNDDGSLSMAPDNSWDDIAYQKYIDGLISKAYVQGIKVDAYSIGLKGKDIGDYNYEMFKSNLQALATAPKDKHATEVGNMVEVENTLNGILDNLETSWVNKKISCSINMRANGDKIRFTLDKSREAMSNNPDNSNVWIEGVFSRDDNSMNDVVYHGCTSSSGRKVVSKQVEINGKTKYQFTFEDLKNLKGENLNIGEVNFWHATATNPVWQPHTEFGQGLDAVTEVERTSAAIMFVMDCSSSLGDDFKELKRVMNDLIDRIVPSPEDSKIGEVVIEADDLVEFYTLQGVKVAKPAKGLYIVKNGKNTRKVNF